MLLPLNSLILCGSTICPRLFKLNIRLYSFVESKLSHCQKYCFHTFISINSFRNTKLLNGIDVVFKDSDLCVIRKPNKHPKDLVTIGVYNPIYLKPIC